ncbi:unnamed protein product, partial [marine sediment metagenome]
QGDIKPLEGERDQNFRVTASDGKRFVLKISSAGEEPEVVDFQIRALEYLRSNAPEINVPQVQRTGNGELTGALTSAAGVKHMVRMLSYVEGVPLSTIAAPSLTVARNAGIFQAGVAQSLANFEHPAEDHYLVWNMSNGLIEDPALWKFGKQDIRAFEGRLRPHFAGHVIPALRELRSQVIHSDGHQDNLLVAEGQPDEIAGLIDFGDMVRAPLVCDAAIMALGFAGDAQDPVKLSAAAIAGFNEVYPLTRVECDLLYDGMVMREALSVYC